MTDGQHHAITRNALRRSLAACILAVASHHSRVTIWPGRTARIPSLSPFMKSTFLDQETISHE
jgi:uncharacterized protein involved in tolerance to divalent cations